MAEHRASCQCKALQIVAANDPVLVIVCNCKACQKRTGSPFGSGAYFKRSDLTITGANKEWARSSDAGRALDNHFCPDCGTTMFWGLELRPNLMGVALGTFDTPLPRPTRVIWTEQQHDWVSFPAEWETHTQGSPPD